MMMSFDYKKIFISNNLDDIKELLDTGWDPSTDNNFAIRYSCDLGYIEVVKLLLQDKRVNPSDWDNWALKWSYTNGHMEILKILLQDSRIDLKNIDRDMYSEIFKINRELKLKKLLQHGG